MLPAPRQPWSSGPCGGGVIVRGRGSSHQPLRPAIRLGVGAAKDEAEVLYSEADLAGPPAAASSPPPPKRRAKASAPAQPSGGVLEDLERTIESLQRINAELQLDVKSVHSSLSDVLAALEAPARPAAQQQAAAPAPAAAPEAGAPATGDDPGHVSCVVQHPGALCCTTASVREDAGTSTVCVTLKTLARLVPVGGSAAPAGTGAAPSPAAATPRLSPDELAALASQAAAAAAAELAHGRVAGLTGGAAPAARRAQHAEIARLLREGAVARTRSHVVSQFGHESYVLDLADAATGRTVRAIFKPRVEGDAGGWHRAPCEVAAYRLNLLLGMDLVPPAAWREPGTVVVDADGGGKAALGAGSMSYWAEGAVELKDAPPGGCPWAADCRERDLLLSDTRVLDVLLHNSDRHAGHFLLARHWCDGAWAPAAPAAAAGTSGGGGEPAARGSWVGAPRPVLIDHAASFRREAYVAMDHENAFCTGPVRRVRARTYLRLRFLEPGAVRDALGPYVSAAELRGLLSRRNAVLAYLDALVERHGYAAVVAEDEG